MSILPATTIQKSMIRNALDSCYQEALDQGCVGGSAALYAASCYVKLPDAAQLALLLRNSVTPWLCYRIEREQW